MATAPLNPSETNQNARHFNTLHWTLLLVSLPFGILNFVLPIYGKQIGASATEIGLSFSAFSLMTILLRPIIGNGLDRYGRRWFFIAGLACYGLTMLSFAYVTTMVGIIAARVVQGVASSLLWLAVNAIVADLAGESNRAQAFGGVSQASNQGGIAGTFIGFSILFSLGFATGWNRLFLGFAVAGLAAAVLAFRRMPETRPAVIQRLAVNPLSGLRAIMKNRSLFVLLLISFVTNATWALTSPILMIFLQEKFHADVSQLAWAFFPSALVWTFLPTRMGKLADRFGRKPLMVISLAVAAVNALLIPRMASLVALAVLWVVEAVCATASDPATQALVTDLTGMEERGRIFGMFALAAGLGATIGPLAGGWLYDTVGQSSPFTGVAILMAISAVVTLLLLREK
jgi:MFS transporter, DHA1 family, multidrug resistance protein